jgi:hypothetical protein
MSTKQLFKKGKYKPDSRLFLCTVYMTRPHLLSHKDILKKFKGYFLLVFFSGGQESSVVLANPFNVVIPTGCFDLVSIGWDR